MQRANELYKFNKTPHSLDDGNHVLTGALGEVMVYDFLANKMPVKHVDSYDFDLLVKGKYRIDVKTIKCSTMPKPHFNCTIQAFNRNQPLQQCHYYIFTRILNTMKTGWILGVIPKSKFFKIATFNIKGSKRGDGKAFSGDCFSINIQDLKPIEVKGEKNHNAR